LLVPSGDDTIGVEVCGSGPAIALLHGSGGNRATWFQQVVDLAADFTVVVVEARGAGRSTDVHGTSGPMSGALDLEAVRLHLGLESWHVVGHSLGGWTALRYATRHPGRCTSVVALSSLAGVFPPEAEAFWQELTAGLSWPVQDLARPLSLTAEFCDDRPDLAYLYQLVNALNPPPATDVTAKRNRDFDLELVPLPVPTTFVTGSLDPIAPADVVKACAAAVGADLEILDGAGHLALWEQPALVNGLLRRLVQRSV
jgi:pimeloyl-ACP methyl ester carboxylesterase